MKLHSKTSRAALAALALAATVGGTAQAAPGDPGMHGTMMMMAQGPMGGPGGPGGRGGPGGPEGPGGMFGGMMMRWLDRVNATPEQRAQIEQIVKANAGERRAQREAGLALREQAMALFAQPTVDANAVEALRQKQLAMHDAASKRMTATMLEISRVLTPEQRKQIAEQMSQRREMMQRHQRERQSLDAPKS